LLKGGATTVAEGLWENVLTRGTKSESSSLPAIKNFALKKKSHYDIIYIGRSEFVRFNE
jgi:hypothetical protein